MKKILNLIISFILSYINISRKVKLNSLFFFFGTILVFASSFGQENSISSPGNKNSGDLLALVIKKINTPSLFVANSNTIISDDQQRSITGIITDSQGEPLPGVNIIEKGTINGAVSDISGRFSINVASGNSILVFSFVGYTPQEITVGTQTSINITLEESAVGLDEVVVIGYGTQTKRLVSGSITSIDQKTFNTGVQRTAADMLQGKVAGLVITTSTGDVTSQQSMRLRGTASLTGSSEPFVVIDGVPGLSMNSVAAQDIESISVLKDASAAAIYGSRSASGVILITTKKGKSNQFTADYNGYLALDVVSNKPDVLTADEWREYVKANGMSWETFDQWDANTDWFGEILRTGITQNHDFSFSGGGATNNYRISVSFLSQEGVAKDNYQDRLNVRFSVNQKALNDRLSVSLIGSITQRDYQPNNSSNFILAYNMLPVYPVKYADGTWFDSTDYDQGNPLRNMTYNYDIRKRNLNYFNLKADLDITKHLSVGLNAYKQRQSTDRSRYYDSETQQGRTEGGVALRSFSNDDTQLIELTANYAIKLNNNDISVLAGYSYEDNYGQSSTAQNRSFVTNLFGANNLSAGENMQVGDVSSNADMNRLLSYFGRVNYSFKERYIVSAALRRDGSSKFGKNNKWGTFPSVSLAWRIIDEPFMQNIGILNDLKLRAGYGVSGNQDGLSPYQSLQLYGSSGTYYDNGAWHTAYSVNQNANPNLQWESTAMSNVGVDFSILGSRLGGTVEYYNKITSNLLYRYQVPVPPYLYSSMIANVGKMQNKGIEVSLTGDIIRTNDLRWTASINAAHNENKITRLSNEEFVTSAIKTGSVFVRGGSSNSTHIIEEGKQVGQFYGYLCTGIDASGLYIYDDMIDGVPGLTINDYTYIGKAQPKLTYGIDNSITYKDIELSFFWRGVYGNDLLNFSRLTYATTQWLPGANVLNEGLTNGLKTSPIYNSWYIEKGSFLRLENVNLAYTFHPDLLGINRVRVYFTGHNLLLLTKYVGVDPELSMNGLDPGIEGRNYYPKSRTYLFGINVSF